jgi:glucosylceramidase
VGWVVSTGRFQIPFIQRAKNLSEGKLDLFASAWTAPKWMKTNGQYAGFGFLHENMYQAWAEYYVKFFGQLSKARDRVLGIDHWKRTQLGDCSFHQNQLGGVVTHNDGTTICTIKNVAEFESFRRLGFGTIWAPPSENSSHSAIKIITLDDQRFFLPWFVNIVITFR